MPEDPKPNVDQPGIQPDQSAPPEGETQEEEVGEFINRHVFEKDSVFFEG